jgi:hypothetical protein
VVRYQPARLTELRHVRQHTLWLRFEDGLEGELDLSDALIGDVFEPLRNVHSFAEARIEYGAVVWPNGADWAPESLRERLLAAKGSLTKSSDDSDRRPAMHLLEMPEISQFFGIVIRMLANDHAPPHFHAYYGEYEVTVTIRDAVVSGQFPGRALRLMLEWRDIHHAELLENWNRLRDGQSPVRIDPLA